MRAPGGRGLSPGPVLSTPLFLVGAVGSASSPPGLPAQVCVPAAGVGRGLVRQYASFECGVYYQTCP